jgi:hypothetical protein
VVTGDPSKPKAWSRYAPDSTAYKKEHEGFKDIEIRDEKRKSENGNKKESKMQELVDKVLCLHSDTQDLHFYVICILCVKYDCGCILLVCLYALLLTLMVRSPLILNSLLHLVNIA